MTLLHPIWLVLSIPLALSMWLWPMPTRMLLTLRTCLFLLLVLALSGLAVFWPSRAGTVVVLVDRSLSVPESEQTARGVIDLVQKGMKPDERLGVISFGRNVVVEHIPQSSPFSDFTGQIDPDGSYLTEALEKALALIPKNEPGRLLVLSDGRWTGRLPDAMTAQAAARGIGIDYRRIERPPTNDLAVARVDTPATVTANEAFLVNTWVQSARRQKVTFRLWRDNTLISSGTKVLSSGLNRLTFRDQSARPGTLSYQFQIKGEGADPIPENNRARFLVGVEGPRSILLVTKSNNSALGRILKASKVDVKVMSPDSCSWTLEALSNYAAVILENVPAQTIGNAGMETVATWIQETGAGLLMTGGRNSYAPGGYYHSPLDPLLPVSLELRQQHRKLKLAIVVTLDRSGSMGMPVAGGRVKMDLANIGTVQVLDLLGPMDELGVLAVDSAPHIIHEIGPIKGKAAIRRRILSIKSMGGGIFIDVALRQSIAMLATAKAGTKHIILFSDAADSEQPGNYRQLLELCRAQGITVSVIGLGSPKDRDGDLLQEIARLGKGRCFFTASPEELPRLFAQDTFVVARSSFITDLTPVKITAGMTTLAETQTFANPPAIGGYNLCYLRPEATLAAVSLDEYKAPLIAAWQAGTGRVACYTGEVDGKHTGPIGKWDKYGDMLTSLVRWTAGPSKQLPGNAVMTQEVRQGAAIVKLHLDPNREKETIITLPKVTTLRASPGEKPSVQKTTMHWTDPDTLMVETPLVSSDTALTTVHIPGHGPVRLTPVCLPYSPEYLPAEQGHGAMTLERMAQATDGKERLDVGDIWQDIAQKMQLWPLAHWLLLGAVFFLLLEVLERRSGVLTLSLTKAPVLLGVLKRIRPFRIRRRIPAPAGTAPAESAPKPVGVSVKAKKAKRATDEAPADDLLGALKQARQRAKKGSGE